MVDSVLLTGSSQLVAVGIAGFGDRVFELKRTLLEKPVDDIDRVGNQVFHIAVSLVVKHSLIKHQIRQPPKQKPSNVHLSLKLTNLVNFPVLCQATAPAISRVGSAVYNTDQRAKE